MHDMANMAFAKKVFTNYEHFYVENYEWTLEKVVALHSKLKKWVTNLQ